VVPDDDATVSADCRSVTFFTDDHGASSSDGRGAIVAMHHSATTTDCGVPFITLDGGAMRSHGSGPVFTLHHGSTSTRTSDGLARDLNDC